MNNDKPAFFIPDILDRAVQPSSLYFQSYESITGSSGIEDFNEQKLIQIQLKLIDYHLLLQSSVPNQEIACIFTHKGAYWLNQDSMNATVSNMDTGFQQARKTGSISVWKLTSDEILDYHSGNLRHLAQAIANDSILFKDLQSRLNGQRDTFTGRFNTIRKNILELLEEADESSHPPFCRNQYYSLLERCRVTRTMLEREETSETSLGYKRDELLKVERYLEDRCLNLNPDFISLQQDHFQSIMSDLLKGERIQLFRAQYWNEFFESIGGPPPKYEIFAELMGRERDGIDLFASNRLNELQQDPCCRAFQHRITDEFKAIENHEPLHTEPPSFDGDALTDEQINALLNPEEKDETLSEDSPPSKPSSTSSTVKRKTPVRGMAFINRRR